MNFTVYVHVYLLILLIKFIEEAENVQMLTHYVQPRTKTDSNRSHG